MSKVKLTQEQAEEIKKIEDIDYAINVLSLNKRPDNHLAKLTIAEIAKALYIGYEVEPEFKVDDWVVSTLLDGYVGQIEEIIEIEGVTGDPKRIKVGSVLHYPDSLRHATPAEIAEEKERIFWKKIGREVNQYKKADLVTVEGWEGVYEVTDYHGNNDWLVTGDFASTENLVGSEALKLVCPVENRLDVETNE